MKKKNLIITLSTIVAVFAIILLYNVYKPDDVLTQLEKARDAAIANGEDYIVAKGENIEVYNSDVQQIMHQYAYWQTGGTYEDAVNAVAGWAAVAYHAEKAGVIVSDDEVREYIDLQKSAGQDAENYADFEAFVKSAGMTVDEYWDAQYNILRMEMLRGKFKEYSSGSADEREQYMADKLKAEKIIVLK